jgi:hypothetical protein
LVIVKIYFNHPLRLTGDSQRTELLDENWANGFETKQPDYYNGNYNG